MDLSLWALVFITSKDISCSLLERKAAIYERYMCKITYPGA